MKGDILQNLLSFFVYIPKGKSFELYEKCQPTSFPAYTIFKNRFTLEVSSRYIKGSFAVKEEKPTETIYYCFIPTTLDFIPLQPFLYAYFSKKVQEEIFSIKKGRIILTLSKYGCDLPTAKYLVIKVNPFVEGDLLNKFDFYYIGEEEIEGFVYDIGNELFENPPTTLVFVDDEEIKKKFAEYLTFQESNKKVIEDFVKVLDNPLLYIVNESKGLVIVPKQIKWFKILLLVSLMAGSFIGYKAYKKYQYQKELELKAKHRWRPSLTFKKQHIAYILDSYAERFKDMAKIFKPSEVFIKEFHFDKRGYTVVYASNIPLKNFQLKGNYYIKFEKKRFRNPPSWESLRYKPKKEVEKFTEIYKEVREIATPEAIKNESIQGVNMLCGKFIAEGKYTSLELEEFLNKLAGLKAIPFKGEIKKTYPKYYYKIEFKVCGF